MSFWSRLRNRAPSESAPSPDAFERYRDGWYVPRGEPAERFIDQRGDVLLRLVPFRDSGGSGNLRIVESSTGLLVHSNDARLGRLGIVVGPMKGQDHHRAAVKAGEFSPGARLSLWRELGNTHDPSAVGLAAFGSKDIAAYVGRGVSSRVAHALDTGVDLLGISVKGTPPGQAPVVQMRYLLAPSDVLWQLLEPLPASAPPPRFDTSRHKVS